MHAQRQADIRALDRLFEEPGTQAFFKETISLALVDQELGKTRAILDQRTGVVLTPCGLVRTEIFFQRRF